MIRDIMIANEAITPNQKEMEILREHFPACFHSDGSFDLSRFSEFLKDKVNITKEGYELKFLGKNYARMLASLDTETVIVPNNTHNSKPENINSENVYISGDNLDGLKHLLKSYSGRIKCIYIDPPYNTGTDGFVYNDKFNFTIDSLMEKLSISEEQAQHILDLTTRGSASHSAWLMFMYPRLQLARDLLSKDGVIFISIDDNEQGNLKLLCDDIFGNSNFIETFIWKRRATPPNDRIIGKNHEYVLSYAKDIEELKIYLQPRDEKVNSRYSNPDNDPRGDWTPSDLSGNGKGGRLVESCIYSITNPITGEQHWPPQNKCWLYNKEKMERLLEDGRIGFRENSGAPYLKKYLTEVRDGITFATLIEDISLERVGTSQTSSKEIRNLFNADVFEFPKPTDLIRRLLHTGMNKNDTVIDFFGGSSTTAESVMQLNFKDLGKRKYILVQLPELVKSKSEAEKAGYSTIDEIGRERIVRAAKKLREENPDTTVDLGFKHYTLHEVSQTTVDKMETFDNSGLITDTTVYDEFGICTVLTTWLVRDNYGFVNNCEMIDLDGYTAYWCGNHLYLITPGLTEEAIKALIEKYNFEGGFNPQNIVLFGYSFNYVEMENLKTNVKVLRDSEKNLKINLDIRY